MNTIVANIIPALWLAWLVYWRQSAFDVKATVRREPFVSRAAHILPLGIAAFLLGWPSLPGWLGLRRLPLGWALYWSGVGLVASGLGFSVWARRVLGRNWSGTVTLKEDHEMIRRGPYRWIRHPIYTGLMIAFIGTAIARGENRGLVAVVLAFAALWRKLRLEESWMLERFGEPYASYRRQSWALFPGLL